MEDRSPGHAQGPSCPSPSPHVGVRDESTQVAGRAIHSRRVAAQLPQIRFWHPTRVPAGTVEACRNVHAPRDGSPSERRRPPGHQGSHARRHPRPGPVPARVQPRREHRRRSPCAGHASSSGRSLRLDLPGPEAVDAMADYLADTVSRHRFDTVLVVLFSATPERADPMAAAALARLDRLGADVVDAFRGDGRRWWPYICTDALCCDPAGTPYDANTTTAAATRCSPARRRLPDRDALRASSSRPSRPSGWRSTPRSRRWACSACDRLCPQDLRRGGVGARSAGRVR